MNKSHLHLRARMISASGRMIQAFCNLLDRIALPGAAPEMPPAFDAETEARCREQRDRQAAYVPKVDVPQHSAVVYRWRSNGSHDA